ncbi:uncharacterized protein BDR25DRAFT_304541 [Lindgomyces ingoldianus]|uniref:Uncharacterized protein n=1 Tax=Lindgomyces ingoldianus TaxID=673940 RepID=A0ACB6QR23_9PLEO|nr:uncharacterized protein BDR25DRAFT_304541 [Lindgomyces ingoldianus]KAF2469474.1 hypothetical protein BDR25DRAFT_304541 [Lindgomyces ingoldianus]
MPGETISVKPIQAFELHPTPIPTTSFFTLPSSSRKLSTRILSTRKTHSVSDFDSGSDNTNTPEYYIDTSASSSLLIWPLNNSQAISIFPGSTSISSISSRQAENKGSISQGHAMLGRFMCTMGGISTRDPLTTNRTPDLYVSSGLGHGIWSDPVLEEKLRLPGEGEGEAAGYGIRGKKVKWHAAGSKWEARVDKKDCEIEWEGWGYPEGGSLVLTGRGNVLALYKPRCASWVKQGGEAKGMKSEGDGVGIGVLGICSERIDEEMARHLLLSAVAIEEQIMWSKGFRPELYHAQWS